MVARSVIGSRTPVFILALMLALGLLGPMGNPTPATAQNAPPPASAGGFLYYKHPLPQPGCLGLGINESNSAAGAPAFTGSDCGFGIFQLSGAGDDPSVTVRFLDEGGQQFHEQDAAYDATDGSWDFDITPDDGWNAHAGLVTAEVVADGTVVGTSRFAFNALAASLTVPAPDDGRYAPGDDIPVEGTIEQLDAGGGSTGADAGAPATFDLLVTGPAGEELTTLQDLTAGADGTFTATVPGSATSYLRPGIADAFRIAVTIAAVDASYQDA